ncbi:hypothetical protein ACHAWF_016441 [Thalassiosira exigua]
MDVSRGSSRRSAAAGRGGQLDWSRGSSRRSGDDLDLLSSRAKTRRYIQRMSSLIVDPNELGLDQRRLQNAIREAGEHSFGVDAISVWLVDEESGKLIHPEGGWWRSERMETIGSGNSAGKGRGKNVALAQLEDSSRDDYVPPEPVIPGTDIAGILWAESRRGDIAFRRSSTLLRAFDSGVSLKSLENQDTSTNLALSSQHVRWRDIKSISLDPDSAKGPRLKLMEEAGFAMAAGIPFQFMHHQGLIIFLTTVEDENDGRLASAANAAYIHQAAQFIGAALALSELRRASLAEQFSLKQKCYRVDALVEKGKEPQAGNDTCQARESSDGKSNFCHVPLKVTAWLQKLKGGSMQPPPSLTWRQSLWTVFGSFVGLLVLSLLNEYYRLLSNEEYFLLIGPFGAMCTLMYGLSAAPASQPRNAVMGQAVAGAVSLAFTYIPESNLPVWLRTAVGPAFAIGTMVKMGVVHPPAGAHSVLYASGKYNWLFYFLVVLSTALSVVPATLVNNLSSKRQYPTYWGLHHPSRVMSWFSKSCHYHDSAVEHGDNTYDKDNKIKRQKVQQTRLVIHEEDDDASSSEGTPAETTETFPTEDV